jgi:acyl-CoA thioesterase FadM
VEVRIGQLRGARVDIDQRIVRIPRETLILDAQAVAVFLDERGRPQRVTAAHRAAFAPYLGTPGDAPSPAPTDG